MKNLHLSFAIRLTDPLLGLQPKGPLFSRWLPNGEAEAITLDTGKSDYILQVWFEHRASVDNSGFIVYDYNIKNQIPNEKIEKQSLLDGGLLFGKLLLKNLSDNQYLVVKENKVGDSEYRDLGKLVIQTILFPRLSAFINFIRHHYGQFWLRPLKQWDSRTHSLGRYCQHINLTWSDTGEDWHKFLPDEVMGNETITVSKFSEEEYLSAQDWQDLSKSRPEHYQPTIAEELLCRTHELTNRGEFRYAFIEGITGLELALGEFTRTRLKRLSIETNSNNQFPNIPLDQKLTIISLAIGNINTEDFKMALEAIKTRNKIVHEGAHINNASEQQLLGLLKVIATLLPGPRKFPILTNANKRSL